VYRAVCKIKDFIFQVSAVHDAMVKEYRPNQHKKYNSMELRPNAYHLCILYQWSQRRGRAVQATKIYENYMGPETGQTDIH